MQHFQSILIVIGILAIGGVLIHGYLLSRKDKLSDTDTCVDRSRKKDMFAEQPTLESSPELTDDVISDVRIISRKSDESETASIDFSQVIEDEKMTSVEFEEVDLETPLQLNEAETVKFEQSKIESAVVNEEKKTPASDLFIFNVAAKEGKLLGGHELLQFFLTSGFRFGDMSIFHRHEHSDGTGPILFSLANMMAPGIFDPDCMEQFKSEGVSFFLTAPNEKINIKDSFDMMLRAVEQMAEEFDCVVLNAEREKMTTEQFINYNNRLSNYI